MKEEEGEREEEEEEEKGKKEKKERKNKHKKRKTPPLLLPSPLQTNNTHTLSLIPHLHNNTQTTRTLCLVHTPFQPSFFGLRTVLRVVPLSPTNLTRKNLSPTPFQISHVSFHSHHHLLLIFPRPHHPPPPTITIITINNHHVRDILLSPKKPPNRRKLSMCPLSPSHTHTYTHLLLYSLTLPSPPLPLHTQSTTHTHLLCRFFTIKTPSSRKIHAREYKHTKKKFFDPPLL